MGGNRGWEVVDGEGKDDGRRGREGRPLLQLVFEQF